VKARWLVALGTGVLAGLATLAARGEPPPLDARLSVRAGSVLLQNGALEPGPRLTRDTWSALPAAQRASAALALIPGRFAPERVALEQEPERAAGVSPILGVECHRATGSLLLADSAADLPDSVWLHELAHVRVHGARPHAQLAQRVITAFEEGVADYYAAVFGGSPRLGFGAQQRDLRQAPNVGPSDWASLAFPSFDPHRLGWTLAAALYEAEPRAGVLLETALACLDGPGPLADADTPAHAITSLLASCPELGKDRLSEILDDWLPPAFLNQTSPP